MHKTLRNKEAKIPKIYGSKTAKLNCNMIRIPAKTYENDEVASDLKKKLLEKVSSKGFKLKCR